MKISGKKVFVTGAGGFIGSHLSEVLVEMGAEVTAMLHYNSRSDWSNLDFIPTEIKKELKVVKGDIEDSSFMDSETKNNDVILHLAALIGIPYSYVAPLSYVRTNIQGTVNVLESVRKNDIELMINTSTSETYGTAIYKPIDEKHPLQGQSPYSASKIAADKLSESYFNSFNTPVITIRPFNTFGPRQSSRAVIPTIITQLLTDHELTLGELKATRDFTYVGDTVRGYINAIEKQKLYGEVINLGFGKTISIFDTAKLIMKLLDKEKKINVDKKRIRPENSEVFELVSDNSKASDILNWQPELTFNEGLIKTISFVKNNLDFYKSNLYNI
tara:strand:- start:279 stop:1268 length:990 start_codon:yes stop_codon:yes gene_type:complete